MGLSILSPVQLTRAWTVFQSQESEADVTRTHHPHELIPCDEVTMYGDELLRGFSIVYTRFNVRVSAKMPSVVPVRVAFVRRH